MTMTEKHKENIYKVFNLLITAVKTIKPHFTDEQARNVVISVVNQIQLDDLTDELTNQNSNSEKPNN